MPTVGGETATHDLILKDQPAGGSTQVDLILAKDRESKIRRWREFRREPFIPRQGQGPVNLADQDPLSGLVFSQKSWDGGAIQAIYDPMHPARYQYADGLDVQGNVITLGMLLSVQIGIMVPNAGFETGDAGGWVFTLGHGSNTLAVTTAAARTGTYGLRMTGIDAVSPKPIAHFVVDSVPSASWDNRSITFGLYGKFVGATPNPAAELLLGIYDGASTALTIAKLESADADQVWTFKSVTHTFTSAPTNDVRCRLTVNTPSSSGTSFNIDDIVVLISNGDVCAGTAVLSDMLYAVVGHIILRWDETNKWFEPVFIHPSGAVATGIEEFNGNIFVAFGGGDNAYYYGSGTSWTASNAAGDEKFAHHFRVVRGTLWKSRHDASGTRNHVNSATNGLNSTDDWGTEVNVGSSDRKITGLHNHDDTLVIGKEDGLHVFNRVANDWAGASDFLNIDEGFRNWVSSENFEKGTQFNGWLYLTVARQGFYRYRRSTGQFQNLTYLLQSSKLGEFGGRVRAITAGLGKLWLLVDVPTTDATTTKETWLMTLEEIGDRVVIHTKERVAVGIIDELTIHSGFLYAIGRLQHAGLSDFFMSVLRWTLPEKAGAAAFDDTPAINTAGLMRLAAFDGLLPTMQKAAISVQIGCKSSVLDAEHTIVVKFGWDGDPASTTTVATFNASGDGDVQTKFFAQATAVGRVLNIEISLASDDTVSPELYWFAVELLVDALDLRSWEVYILVGDHIENLAQVDDQVDKGALITNLETLEGQAYPLELTHDFDGDGVSSTERVKIRKGSLLRVPQDEYDEGTEIWRMVLDRVVVS